MLAGLFGGGAPPPKAPRPHEPSAALTEEVAATAARQEAELARLEQQIQSGALRFDSLSLNDAPHTNGKPE